jgi:DNA/RNA endonuclease YhcR with UshA esterase domain
MEEDLLLKISIICSIAGLISLFLISNFIESKPVNISGITPDDIGSVVKICGNITNKYISKNKHIFLNIEDNTGNIKVVIFNQTTLNLNIDPYELKKHDNVCVIGKVDIYENELEIILRDLERNMNKYDA